jgi:hypothetical protein
MIVGVIGSGSIGPDLAYGFLTAVAQTPGAKVYLVDIKQEAPRRRGRLASRATPARAWPAASSPPRSPPRWRPPWCRPKILGLLKDCTYVLEAASEDLAVKRAILAKLEAVVAPSCLIGFATSGLPRAQIAASAAPPRAGASSITRSSPAWRSLPIEVVLSGDAALGAQMIATMKRLGKVPILTADVECFAADDIFCNYISEAARLVAEGIRHAGPGRSHRQRRDRRRRAVQRDGRDPRQPAHGPLPGAHGPRADRVAVVRGPRRSSPRKATRRGSPRARRSTVATTPPWPRSSSTASWRCCSAGPTRSSMPAPAPPPSSTG